MDLVRSWHTSADLRTSVSLMIYQFGCLFTGNVHVVGLIFAVAALAGIIYMLARPYKEATKLTKNVKIG